MMYTRTDLQGYVEITLITSKIFKPKDFYTCKTQSLFTSK